MTVEIVDIVESVEQLPVLPGTTLRLINILSDVNTSIDQVVDAIRHDQNLTAQVLKLCNSAYFGLSRQIVSLQDAVTYLGATQLLQLVFSVHCKSTFSKNQEGYGLLAGMLWKHSNAVAIASEKIANHKNLKPTSGLLFTAGLLHDIGKVILDQALSEHYQQVLELAETEQIRFDEAEKIVLGFSHEDIGQMIANKWQLPEEIVATTKYHHESENYKGNDDQVALVVEVVHIADSLVMMLGIGIGTDGLRYRINENLINKYELKKDYIDRLGVEVLASLEKIEKLYGDQNSGS